MTFELDILLNRFHLSDVDNAAVLGEDVNEFAHIIRVSIKFANSDISSID